MPGRRDDTAERTVAGCAIASAEGSALAISRLGAQDFYDPRLWAVVNASADLLPLGLVDAEEHWKDAEEASDWLLVTHGCAARVKALSQTYERSWLVSLVTQRCVARDDSGWFAHRVKEAASNRREVLEHISALETLGVDVPVLMESAEEYRRLCDRLDLLEAVGGRLVLPEWVAGLEGDLVESDGRKGS